MVAIPTQTPGSRHVGGPTLGRRPDIQGLRAIAVGMVVAFHAGLPVPGGFTGVDVFFVISGFVITGMLSRQRSRGLRLRTFYLRRYMRLTPALAATILAVLIAATVIQSPIGPQETTAATALGAMLLMANAVIFATTGGYFDTPAETNPLLNTWSLSVEEQFYLVFPAVLVATWLLSRRRQLRWTTPAAVGLLTIASFLFALMGASGIVGPRTEFLFGFYGPASRAWEFGVGALLALGSMQLRRLSPAVRSAAGWVGGAGIALSLWAITPSTPFPSTWTLIPVIGTALLLAAGESSPTPVSRVLSHPGFVRVGDWSYSIYLWHWPVIVLAVALWPSTPWVPVAAAAISLAPALASYRWLEEPLRHRIPASRRSAFATVALITGVPVVVAGALLVASSQGFWMASIRDLRAASTTVPAGEARGCDLTVPLSAELAKACTFGADATGSPIYLVGDSNADHFSDGLERAAADLGRPLSVSTSHACPFVLVSFRWTAMDDRWNADCRAFVEGTMGFLEQARPGLVVISNIDWYWRSDRTIVRPWADSSGSSSVPSEREALAIYEDGMGRTIDRLHAAGHEVLVIQSVPQWPNGSKADPRRCSTLEVALGDCTESMTRLDALGRQGQARSATEAAALSSGAVIWDPWVRLCPERECRSGADARTRYRDANHLSVDQSRALAPDLESAINEFDGT